jgi:hypothetical protein
LLFWALASSDREESLEFWVFTAHLPPKVTPFMDSLSSYPLYSEIWSSSSLDNTCTL